MDKNKFIKEQQQVNQQLDTAYEKLNDLKDEKRALVTKIDDLLKDQQKHEIVSEIIELLDKLHKIGGDQLFWGDEYTSGRTGEYYTRIRGAVDVFDGKVRDLRERRASKEDEIHHLAENVGELNERTLVLEELAEELDSEFQIEREMDVLPYRPMIMPWSRQAEDERRFRKILLITLLIAFLLGSAIPLWDIPIPERMEVAEVPERFARLIIEKKPPPPPKPVVQEKKPEETSEAKAEKTPHEDAPKPITEKAKIARKKAERAGLMAFKQNFSELINIGDVDAKLGASARISSAGKTGKSTTRSIVTSSVGGSSAGINTASLSRDTGGAGKGIEGVGFSRVESAIGSDFFGEERPLSEGAGPSRTDEEIQIVFDRYKAALYRIYNRELRKNPTLQGKMVIRLTIEPDGSVSACKLDSSDMDSPSLEDQIVDRVKNFNFGVKEDVPPITILYPIDFLPASG